MRLPLVFVQLCGFLLNYLFAKYTRPRTASRIVARPSKTTAATSLARGRSNSEAILSIHEV
jgi:hypothetical protein